VAEVHETEELYHRLVALSPDCVFINRDTRVVFVNAAAVRLFGASTPEQVLGRSPFDIFHPDCHATIRERITRLLAGHSVPTIEEKIVRLDGAVIDVEVASTMFHDRQGPAIQVIVRDITGRKRTEDALRESEQRLTLAFAAAQEGVWDWNVETGTVVYSPRWCEMLGYAEHEIEPNIETWSRLLHPDDRERAREVVEGATNGDRDYEVEFRLRHKNGR
jgi:PAS domain S-box-containing protein